MRYMNTDTGRNIILATPTAPDKTRVFTKLINRADMDEICALLVEYKYLRQSTNTNIVDRQNRVYQINRMLSQICSNDTSLNGDILFQFASNRIGNKKIPTSLRSLHDQANGNNVYTNLIENAGGAQVNYNANNKLNGDYTDNLSNFYEKYVLSVVGIQFPNSLHRHIEVINYSALRRNRGLSWIKTCERSQLEHLLRAQTNYPFSVRDIEFRCQANIEYRTTQNAICVSYQDKSIIIATGGTRKESVEVDLERLCRQTKMDHQKIYLLTIATNQQEQLYMPFAVNHALMAIVQGGRAVIVDPKSKLPGRLSKQAVSNQNRFLYPTVFAGIQGAINHDCTRYALFINYYVCSYILKNPDNSSLSQIIYAIRNNLKGQRAKRDIASYLCQEWGSVHARMESDDNRSSTHSNSSFELI